MQYDISFIKDVIISDEKYERSFNEHIGLFSIDCINKNKNLLFDNNESKPRIASNISLKKILFIKIPNTMQKSAGLVSLSMMVPTVRRKSHDKSLKKILWRFYRKN